MRPVLHAQIDMRKARHDSNRVLDARDPYRRPTDTGSTATPPEE